MRAWRLGLLCIVAAVTFGCAHFDPAVLETAETLPQGGYKLDNVIGTTQDIGAWIPAEEDSLWRASRYLLGDYYTRGAVRNRVGIGLGDNMELLIGGQFSIVPDRGVRIKYGGGPGLQFGYMGRLGIKKVWRVSSNFACAAIPSLVVYNSGSTSRNDHSYTLWVGSEAYSVEMPLIASIFIPAKHGRNAINLTLRPGYTAMDRDIRNTLAYSSGPYSWYSDWRNSRLETAHLYRIAGMAGMDIRMISGVRIKFEIGTEAVYHARQVHLMPIVAMSWTGDGSSWPPWGKRP